jgi:hypothetical protein
MLDDEVSNVTETVNKMGLQEDLDTDGEDDVVDAEGEGEVEEDTVEVVEESEEDTLEPPAPVVNKKVTATRTKRGVTAMA